MEDGKAGTGRRSVGARDRIVSHLAAVGEVSDPNGLASAHLAEAVGYAGSSAAFAQLLSGMERAGLIDRQIRGKRTYRIGLAVGAAVPAASMRPSRRARPPMARTPAQGAHLGTPGNVTAREPDSGAQADGLDYDALARRLLVQVVQRLTMPSAEHATPAAGQPSAGKPEPRQAQLVSTLTRLERKLASTESRQRKLSEENARLREELAAAQQSLAELQGASARESRLDTEGREMLERLVSSLQASPARRDSAEAG